jgi:RHS repeat-associated protein
MPRTAPVPNIPAIPGMNPGAWVKGGGAGGGSGSGSGKGGKNGQGAGGGNGGNGAEGGGKGAGSCGNGSKDGGGCPNNHDGGGGGLSRGDPVDVVTGRVFTVPVADVSFPGPLPLLIERAYSSHARARDVGLGPGWTHSLAWQIVERRRSLLVFASDGLEHDFGHLEPGTGVAGPHGWVLHREGAGLWLDRDDGRQLRFDLSIPFPGGARWLLTEIADRSQSRITLTYDGGLLAGARDTFGRVVSFRRDRAGRVASIDAEHGPDAPGRATLVRYTYDDAGRLIEVQDADGWGTRFSYDDDNRLTSQLDPTGLRFSYRYDGAGRCTETWGEYPGRVDPSLVADVPALLADGQTPARGALHVKMTYGPDFYSEAVDSVAVQRYFGNAQGLVDKAVTPLGVFQRTYSPLGFLETFTDPLGATTTWQRDSMGRELAVTDPIGRTTVTERDARGEIDSVTGPDGDVVRYQRSGDTLSWTDAIGATTLVRFDPYGLPIEARWPDGRVLVWRRDAHGNVVEHVDELGARTQARWDAWGRCVEVRDARGGVTLFGWSPGGRLLSRQLVDGSLERYEQDGVGNLTALTDGAGSTMRIAYGGFRKVVRVDWPNGEVTQARYNREGWLMEVENGRGEVHRYERAASGLPVAEHTFDGRELRYEYDQLGRVLRSRNGLGEWTEYEHDLAGQLVRMAFDDGSEETFEHNGRGEVVRATGAAGTFSFARNGRGWVTEETQEVDGQAVRVETEFRNTGEIARRRTSLGHTAQYTHDFARRQVALFLDDRPEAIFAVDVDGREVVRSLAGGGRIETGYDSAGRMVERRVVSDAHGTAGRIAAGEPAWVGRVPPGTLHAEANRYAPSGVLAEVWKLRSGSTELRHDPVGQLTAVVREGREVASFRYDLAGNLHDVTHGAAPRSYGPGGRLERRGEAEYAWDQGGRLVEKRVRLPSGAFESTRYAWSAADTLAAVERADGTRVTFAYDPFGRRVSKKVIARDAAGGERLLRTTRFVWDAGRLVHELCTTFSGEAEQVEERTWVFELARTVPIAHRDVRVQGESRTESPWWHYLNDDSGAPELLVGPDGLPACELVRMPWGHAEPAPGARTTTPLRFRGQYADEETGLAYNRHRYYDPEVGRYTSADPIGLDGGLNAFAYAGNCPTSAVDVEGLMFTVIKDASGKVVASGHNAGENKPMPAPHSAVPGGKPCAERSALTDLANKMGPGTTQADIAKKFKDDGYKMETYEGNDQDYKRGKHVAANPCETCKKMLKDVMGIPPSSVQGHSPTNLNKVKPWDGHSTYNPATNKIFQNKK